MLHNIIKTLSNHTIWYLNVIVLTIISLLNNLKMIRWLLNACQLHVLFLTRYTGNSRGDFLSFYLRFHRFHICHDEALNQEATSGIPTSDSGEVVLQENPWKPWELLAFMKRARKLFWLFWGRYRDGGV